MATNEAKQEAFNIAYENLGFLYSLASISRHESCVW